MPHPGNGIDIHSQRHRRIPSVRQLRGDSNAHSRNPELLWRSGGWGWGVEGVLRAEDRAVKHFRARHSKVMKHGERIYLCNI